MKIGTIDLGERPVTLAPMEDVTDASFRILCREAGAKVIGRRKRIPLLAAILVLRHQANPEENGHLQI